MTSNLTGLAARQATETFGRLPFLPLSGRGCGHECLWVASPESFRHLVVATYYRCPNTIFTVENTLGIIYIAWVEKREYF